MLNTTEDMVHEQLKMLQGRNLIREQEPGKWVRKVLDEKTGKFQVHGIQAKPKSRKHHVFFLITSLFEGFNVDVQIKQLSVKV